VTFSNGIVDVRPARPDVVPDGDSGVRPVPATAGPTAGLVLQVAVLGAIAATAGLGGLGWAVGLAFGGATWALLVRGLRRTGRAGLGPADRVTLGRTVLVGGVTALAVDGLVRAVPLPLVVALTGVALALDGVDGQVARRTRTASGFGARFDMEVDAFLILVLSVLLIGPVGPWAVALGGMRYAFVAAGAVRPWILAPLPPRLSRKAVAALQGVVLVVAVAGVLPAGVTRAAVAGALAALCWSFGRDLGWLVRHRQPSRPSRSFVVRSFVVRSCDVRSCDVRSCDVRSCDVQADPAVPAARRPATVARPQYGRDEGARPQPVATA
jgi:phosphatidylglycerophosphate synthase